MRVLWQLQVGEKSLEVQLQAVASLQVWVLGTKLGSSAGAVCALNCRVRSLSSSRWDLHPARALSLGVRLTALACGFVVLCFELVLVPGSGEAFYKLVMPQLLSSKLCPTWILDTNKPIFTFFPLYPWAYKVDFFSSIMGRTFKYGPCHTFVCLLGGKWRDQMSHMDWGRTWSLGSAVCSGWCLSVTGRWPGKDRLLIPLPISFPLKIWIQWRQVPCVSCSLVHSVWQTMSAQCLLNEWLNDRGRHLLWHRDAMCLNQ